MVLMAPGGRIPKDLSWAAGKKFMGNVDAFLKSLVTFDKDNVPVAAVDVVERDYVRGAPGFTPEAVGSKSRAAAGLCSWVINIAKYFRIYQVVCPGGGGAFLWGGAFVCCPWGCVVCACVLCATQRPLQTHKIKRTHTHTHKNKTKGRRAQARGAGRGEQEAGGRQPEAVGHPRQGGRAARARRGARGVARQGDGGQERRRRAGVLACFVVVLGW
jgi:hypothetical protein